MRQINVARPLLPSAERLLPYLREIDGNRWYSNWGPLVMELERRLADHLGAAPEEVVTVGNGTLGLTLALMAHKVTAGDYCLMPSWTFTATPLAALGAGLVPYFVDVEPGSWGLTPALVRRQLQNISLPVAAIMPVVPFGLPMDGAEWDALSKETGIPVIVDAAAAMDTWRPSEGLSMISLHATKLLGIGEGGLVLSRTRPLVANVRQRANFGFAGTRDTQIVAMNAKLSEYGAAVGLAALDALPDTRASFMRVAGRYVERLSAVREIILQSGFGTSWVATTFNILVPALSAVEVASSLNAEGVETRYWWGRGAHEHPAFKEFPHGDLSATRWLADHTLGLPMSADMSIDDVDYVCDALERLIRSRTPQVGLVASVR